MKETETAGVSVKIVELLAPLTSEERLRVVNAALTLVGEALITPPGEKSLISEDNCDGGEGELPVKARSWAKQNGIGFADLQQVFHFEDGKVEVIASEMPGQSDKERTHNAYVLTGIAKLLSSNAPHFDDETARDLCKSSGCFNQANHATYLTGKGNLFTGSKKPGWTLTAPGLKQGATLIKELIKQVSD